MVNKKNLLMLSIGAVLATTATASFATTDISRPNILAIWGDDIGMDNISAYTRGQAGHWTPNIDRIANEGVLFTDFYGEQSCTAGRSAFITGQHVMRTGLSKVGMPGAKQGIKKEDPTIAAMLKDKGYMTGQFGKNHLGDLDEHLPTNHGFDEFFGNLYHLNAEEEPEHADYPQDPAFKKQFGPRGVIHSYADGRVEDTGALSIKRMETVDEEFLVAALDFIDRAHKEKKPFFVWYNSTRMHVWTHLKEESKGLSKRGGLYGDGMVEHDNMVGQLLDKLDDLKIADNTIVSYTSDNGVEKWGWPDGGTARYRGEKNSTWEGGFRVPAMVRWPNQIPSGQVVNEIAAHNDWAPTFLAAAGEPEMVAKLKEGTKLNGTDYRVHLDGYNLMPKLIEAKSTTADDNADWPRKNYVYAADDGHISAIRMGDWKVMFTENNCHGIATWRCDFEELRLPHIFNLRQDPYEIAIDEGAGYPQWQVEHLPYMYMAASSTYQFLQTFEEFPPRQQPGSWTVKSIVDKMQIWERAQYK
ncbi:arylsulfatase [Vibrio splendidus]|uniref:arylsulfatase n=1 Tax=Vibrio TaxID=662 RepID=UPI001555F65E|nr:MULTISPECIES: arylsulfatase [Vibrio]MDH5911476.1 arylsulfatase [Vibrio splendidus]MDH5942739.1 arylsulfatase [Vibrio splendidus]MDH5985714.1 arylsulfatase [Vibrio splendidus]MDH5994316.1 arylsulfatase [Vibrio splendidus]MDH6005141.1 arylsulfatase [Vibrio splendidus]